LELFRTKTWHKGREPGLKGLRPPQASSRSPTLSHAARINFMTVVGGSLGAGGVEFGVKAKEETSDDQLGRRW